jgi:hypothetical protein
MQQDRQVATNVATYGKAPTSAEEQQNSEITYVEPSVFNCWKNKERTDNTVVVSLNFKQPNVSICWFPTP